MFPEADLPTSDRFRTMKRKSQKIETEKPRNIRGFFCFIGRGGRTVVEPVLVLNT
jgi:hypothetical protein